MSAFTKDRTPTDAAPGVGGTGTAAVTPAAAVPTDIETLCRRAFASWDGYRGLGGVRKQHFTEEQRDEWRELFRTAIEGAPA